MGKDGKFFKSSKLFLKISTTFYGDTRHIIHALLYLAQISIIRARIRQLRHILSTSYASTSVLK